MQRCDPCFGVVWGIGSLGKYGVGVAALWGLAFAIYGDFALWMYDNLYLFAVGKVG